jgi:hypothetical protein
VKIKLTLMALCAALICTVPTSAQEGAASTLAGKLQFDRVSDTQLAQALDAQKWRTNPGVYAWRTNNTFSLIAIGREVVPEGKDSSLAQPQAELDARKRLAEFLGGIATTHKEQRSTTIVESNGSVQLSVEEVSSFTNTSTDVLLNKAVMVGTWGTADSCFVVYRLEHRSVQTKSAPTSKQTDAVTSGSNDLKVVNAKGVGSDATGDKAKAYAAAMDAAKRQALEQVCRQTVRAVASNKVKDFSKLAIN